DEGTADDEQHRDLGPAGVVGSGTGHQLPDQEHARPEKADDTDDGDQRASPGGHLRGYVVELRSDVGPGFCEDSCRAASPRSSSRSTIAPGSSALEKKRLRPPV